MIILLSAESICTIFFRLSARSVSICYFFDSLVVCGHPKCQMVGEWGLLLVGGRMGAATCFRLQAPDERGLQAKLKPERCFCRLVAL